MLFPLIRESRLKRSDNDSVEGAVFERLITFIYLTLGDPSRNQVVQVHPALQVQLCVHRNVTLCVSRAEIYSRDALLSANRTKNVHTDVDFGFRHSDQVQATADSEHCEPLLGHCLQPYEVEDVISSGWQEIADGLDGFRRHGVDDVGGAESSGHVEALLLDVNHNYP